MKANQLDRLAFALMEYSRACCRSGDTAKAFDAVALIIDELRAEEIATEKAKQPQPEAAPVCAPGYRWVEVGEILEAGDQFRAHNGKDVWWNVVSGVGHTNPSPFGYRRPLSVEAPPAPAFGTWQPIETAPKGSARVLVGWDASVWVAQAYQSKEAQWHHDGSGTPLHKPTHWMPLPPPPTK